MNFLHQCIISRFFICDLFSSNPFPLVFFLFRFDFSVLSSSGKSLHSKLQCQSVLAENVSTFSIFQSRPSCSAHGGLPHRGVPISRGAHLSKKEKQGERKEELSRESFVRCARKKSRKKKNIKASLTFGVVSRALR